LPAIVPIDKSELFFRSGKMNTIKTQFNIGIDGTHSAVETLRASSFVSAGLRRNDGASLLRGR